MPVPEPEGGDASAAQHPLSILHQAVLKLIIQGCGKELPGWRSQQSVLVGDMPPIPAEALAARPQRVSHPAGQAGRPSGRRAALVEAALHVLGRSGNPVAAGTGPLSVTHRWSKCSLSCGAHSRKPCSSMMCRDSGSSRNSSSLSSSPSAAAAASSAGASLAAAFSPASQLLALLASAPATAAATPGDACRGRDYDHFTRLEEPLQWSKGCLKAAEGDAGMAAATVGGSASTRLLRCRRPLPSSSSSLPAFPIAMSASQVAPSTRGLQCNVASPFLCTALLWAAGF